MSRIIWNQPGERFYEAGVDHGVLYPKLGPGVPWNGLVSVSEDSSGGDIQALYVDGVKYLDYVSNEDFQATIEAYSAPAEFASCEGTKTLVPGLYATQQPRTTFGLSYRTLLGNDLQGFDYGYKLHLVYGCTAEPSGVQHKTLGESTSLGTRQWAVHTVPQAATAYKPTAHLVFDSTKIDPYQLEEIESYLYGAVGKTPRLLDQSEILDLLANTITEPISASI